MVECQKPGRGEKPRKHNRKETDIRANEIEMYDVRPAGLLYKFADRIEAANRLKRQDLLEFVSEISGSPEHFIIIVTDHAEFVLIQGQSVYQPLQIYPCSTDLIIRGVK